MQALEKPEGSATGISYLTTRNVYDWKQKPYQHGDGISVKRWKRRSRQVATGFAFDEGKRDDILSPATSGHVLKLLPAIFFQRISEGEGAFSQTLGCLDVKDAFLQVPQEKPLKVILRGAEFLVKRNQPGQRVGRKRGLTFPQRTSQRNSTINSVLSVHA